MGTGRQEEINIEVEGIKEMNENEVRKNMYENKKPTNISCVNIYKPHDSLLNGFTKRNMILLIYCSPNQTENNVSSIYLPKLPK